MVRQRAFETRLEAIEFLQLKFPLLKRYKAIAAPVLLPVASEYTDAIEELTALGERLRALPAGWSHAKAIMEKKVVDQNRKLNYMERAQNTGPKELHWAVYLVEEADNGFVSQNRSRLQQADQKRPPAA